MLDKTYISSLRHESRKLIRELGLLQLNQPTKGKTSSHWHALIEIEKSPGITIANLSSLLLLSPSALSRIVNSLIKKALVSSKESQDKREKCLTLTPKGLDELKQVDQFSNPRIIGALDFLSAQDHALILEGLSKYVSALEKSRLDRQSIQIHTLSTSRPLRQQVVSLIESIQIQEFGINITPEINACVLKPEKEFSYNKRCHFWYAVNGSGHLIGTVALKAINPLNGEIKKFFVRKDYRGKGVSYKLIQKALSAAKKNEFQTLYLGTVSKLKAAKRFYEKIGFDLIQKEDLPREFDACPLDTVFFKGAVNKIACST